jgi:hypothetical protein
LASTRSRAWWRSLSERASRVTGANIVADGAQRYQAPAASTDVSIAGACSVPLWQAPTRGRDS